MDHTSLLGHTIESIAWNKAGIMKKGCLAFTVPQSEPAMDVIKQRSIEKNVKLKIIKSTQFKLPMNFGPEHVLNLNASLAVNLCQAWMSISEFF